MAWVEPDGTEAEAFKPGANSTVRKCCGIMERIHKFLVVVVMIGTIVAIIVTVIGWQKYHYSEFFELSEVPFSEVSGGCSLSFVRTTTKSVCSQSNSAATRSCKEHTRYIYNVTVNIPTSDLLPNANGYVSEPSSTDFGTAAQNVPCWYSTEPTRATATSMPCGSPQCMKVDSPTEYTSSVGEPTLPVVATAAAGLMFVMSLALCFGPFLCRKFGIISDTDSESSSSDEHEGLVDADWSELTKEQCAAAKVLGYTQQAWDNDEQVPVDAKDWVELTPAEQKAAKVLGYTQDLWDA
eukprot:gnl/TRDRNA2_/TRDRNA2_90611_c0_seq1.p1 gnl/TRDRNA2_/TRDRNA2_90611_c0~~gnl/TRDRNA2_/TRDRNA2_90611_c0_seq1.p1  ORF type:complete len:295 (-),score=38.43 gnl/TRDRNA2_/TRDRNA2_90611_c0_seq1:118-1002(-)